jgi:hypothetical protein
MQLKIDKPCTVYVKLPQSPDTFNLYDSNNKLYYFRFLTGEQYIKFNIPDNGIYHSDSSFIVENIGAIELPYWLPHLPYADRNRYKHEPDIIVNPAINGETPARNFTDESIIEVSDEFLAFPLPIQRFLQLHEIGHYFYADEFNCDLYAFVNFMREGYNSSTAFYSLSCILKQSRENMDRIREMYDNIQSITKHKL